jgi:hypothetical protein
MDRTIDRMGGQVGEGGRKETGAGVRNASSISTATPTPVIASLVGRFMTKSSREKRAKRPQKMKRPKSKDGQSFWQCAMGDST